MILQQALEDEVSEFLGRRRYERGGEPVAYRNGYEPRRVRTTSGAVELERPRVRDASKLGFESRVLGKHVTRVYALELLVISSFLRGLSTRRVEAALEETFDEQLASRSTVSRVLEDTRERYRRWRGVTMTPKTVAEIERNRRQQHPAATTDTKEVIAA